jgi:hypothetical protein
VLQSIGRASRIAALSRGLTKTTLKHNKTNSSKQQQLFWFIEAENTKKITLPVNKEEERLVLGGKYR